MAKYLCVKIRLYRNVWYGIGGATMTCGRVREHDLTASRAVIVVGHYHATETVPLPTSQTNKLCGTPTSLLFLKPL